MHRIGVFWAFLSLLAVGCGSDSLAQLGERCVIAEECESNLCNSDVCSQPCASSAECGNDNAPLVCAPDGACSRPCTRSQDFPSGRFSCGNTGEFVACMGRDPVEACSSCGCEVFGGGECVEGLGCVVPRANGEACELDVQCSSGVCQRDSNTCGSPRAMGEPCTVDVECATRNCSTDGAEGVEGVCNQELGTACELRRSGDTCTRCIEGFLSIGTMGLCSRANCDPDTAPNCPSISGRQWSCERTTEGTFACFERCNDDDFSFTCFRSGDFCRRGFCQ